MLDFFPGVPRPQQRTILERALLLWADHDALAITAPTGVGKSNVAVAMALKAESMGYTAAIVVHDGNMQRQYEDSFPDLPSLWGGDDYNCVVHHTKHCHKVAKLKRSPCTAACLYRETLAKCKRGVRLMHLYTYQGNHGRTKRLPWPDLVIFDEAHKLHDYLAAQAGVSLWRKHHQWPMDATEHQDLMAWIDRQPRHVQLAKAKKLLSGGAVVVREYGELYGKSELRLRIEPKSVRNHPPILWPPKAVKKVVGLSATFGPRDAHELGWYSLYRVGSIEVDSPIPPGVRPVVVMPEVPASLKDRELALPELARVLQKLATHHAGEAGLVHATYEEAHVLKRLLSSPRFLWHDYSNKKRVIADFVAGAAGPGRILVASGVHEGLDLAGDRARWQVLTKIPRLDIGVAEVAVRAEQEPEWYWWQSVKATIQACGRVCRGPEDYGVTYVFDPLFAHLFRDYAYLWPAWFQESVRW